MKKSLFKKLFCFAFLLILSFSFSSAFGVATIYSDNYPMSLKPGEEKETFFLLRNVVQGDEDVVIRAELTEGLEIAEFVNPKEFYDLPFGEEIMVNVKIKIPGNAQPGKRYIVGAIFRPAPKDIGGGNIQLLINIGKSFPVQVIGEQYLSSVDNPKEAFTLTLESEELVEGLQPYKGEGVASWIWWLIGGLAAGIIIMGFVISYLLGRRKKH